MPQLENNIIRLRTDFVLKPQTEKELNECAATYKMAKSCPATIASLKYALENILRSSAREQNSECLPKVSVSVHQYDPSCVVISLDEMNPVSVEIFNNIPSEPELLWDMIRDAEKRLVELDGFKSSDKFKKFNNDDYKKIYKGLEKFAKDYEFADNFRVANIEDEKAVALYYVSKRHGCCGFYDSVREDDTGTWLVGFNWGH